MTLNTSIRSYGILNSLSTLENIEESKETIIAHQKRSMPSYALKRSLPLGEHGDDQVETKTSIRCTQSSPSLTYQTNGLKRNKSGSFNEGKLVRECSSPLNLGASLSRKTVTVNSVANVTFGQPNATFGLIKRNTQPSNKKHNAIFDLIRKQPTRKTFQETHHNSTVLKRTPLRSTSSCLNTIIVGAPNERTITPTASHTDPKTTLISILKEEGYKAKIRKSAELTDFFVDFTEEHIAGYDFQVVNAIREKNIPVLREMHASGRSLQCANRFGESLLHMACRRGYTDVVSFLLGEAKVPLRVKDDYGRTPLHDACWAATPNFDLMGLLIAHDSDLLLIADNRGHLPLSYVRHDHWNQWSEFLLKNRSKLHLSAFQEPLDEKPESPIELSNPISTET